MQFPAPHADMERCRSAAPRNDRSGFKRWKVSRHACATFTVHNSHKISPQNIGLQTCVRCSTCCRDCTDQVRMTGESEFGASGASMGQGSPAENIRSGAETRLASGIMQANGRRTAPYSGGRNRCMNASDEPAPAEGNDFGDLQFSAGRGSDGPGCCQRRGARFGPRALRDNERIGP